MWALFMRLLRSTMLRDKLVEGVYVLVVILAPSWIGLMLVAEIFLFSLWLVWFLSGWREANDEDDWKITTFNRW